MYHLAALIVGLALASGCGGPAHDNGTNQGGPNTGVGGPTGSGTNTGAAAHTGVSEGPAAPASSTAR